jgi:hypothetical protein
MIMEHQFLGTYSTPKIFLLTVGAKSIFCRRRKVSDFYLLHLLVVDAIEKPLFRHLTQHGQGSFMEQIKQYEILTTSGLSARGPKVATFLWSFFQLPWLILNNFYLKI